MATTTTTLASNVAHLRKARGHTVRSLAVRLDELGCPIHSSGLTKIEQGKREPRVAELLALAIALGVSPNRLMLPIDDSPISLTPKVDVNADEAWAWATSRRPLQTDPAENQTATDRRVQVEDFRRNSLPTATWAREDNPAARAANDVRDRVEDLLETPLPVDLRPLVETDEFEKRAATAHEEAENRVAAVDTALARLRAELDDVVRHINSQFGGTHGKR